MPSWRNIPSMPNVRDSSGTIGTTCLPIVLSRTSVPSICTNAIVVEISRSPELCERRRLAPPLRQESAQPGTPLLQVFHLRTVLGERDERHLCDLVVRHRYVE